ncbi:unnamed protein product [Arabidopsis thaliana]|uniref:Mitochondrial glycoprotein superfamily n=2 Tax=Arabidopsis TaxID=3701 RepID=A0A8T2EEV2_ARASU|nr:Mitochondrial glycoprotein superfamily [Arabidopsis suecica]CAA0397187.1 unnamed protein product [Arabidopsis thaliana]CAD5329681.1 unnamed protein product [Arabidopsis thaliana]VYS64593.1 unnamed protein product [Arabidopsis thaliana]
MALLLRTLQKSRISPSHSSRTLISWVRCKSLLPNHQSRDVTTSPAKSPFRSNILRIIRNEIEYQSDYAPPHQPATEFKSFSVEDCPGEQCIVMKGKFGEDEDIKMEATMFDGFMNVPRAGLDASGHDVRLHISLLVDISKVDGSEEIEFLCSVWPNRIEIRKLYKLRRNKITGQPYMGPNFGNLKYDFQTAVREFLRVRGIDAELCFFLHEYMMNKDRIELIQWLRKLNSFISQ